ncbi:hypothetical protein [Neisseria canis]|uniref:Uncharacterized protein n=1 Tax=Neisseria canis TaxID=493 RepID=A0A3S4Q9L9_9NEIS|nr:hypothetical protein [Neisseria canis]VEE98905.1 Uncharacterised protein [Neisseria canis]
MKRIRILITLISLIAGIFYLLPACLKHREIRAAQADLQLLASENTEPSKHPNNGYAAL